MTAASTHPPFDPELSAALAAMPPELQHSLSVETFRDEDIDYAARLSRAGVSVEFHLWPGGFHGFDGLAPRTTLARAARAARLDYLRRALAA